MAENKRGLLPLDPVKHARFHYASDYGFVWPEVTYPVNKSGGVSDFGMGGNGPDPEETVYGGQPVSDCVANAAPKNCDLTTAAMLGLLGDQTFHWSSNKIVTLYFIYQAELAGLAWRPPADYVWTQADIDTAEPLDVGVDMGDWLLWCFKQGLIEGFLKIDAEEVASALQTFDVVISGVCLNPNADEQFENHQVWSIGPGDQPDCNDGHGIQLVSILAATGPRIWATWGRLQGSTYAWALECPQQYFALLTKVQADKVGFPFAKLVADLRAVGGTAVTPPKPPEPTPAPTVVPTPVEPPAPIPAPPVPVPVPSSHEGFLRELRDEAISLIERIDKELTS